MKKQPSLTEGEPKIEESIKAAMERAEKLFASVDAYEGGTSSLAEKGEPIVKQIFSILEKSEWFSDESLIAEVKAKIIELVSVIKQTVTIILGGGIDKFVKDLEKLSGAQDESKNS